MLTIILAAVALIALLSISILNQRKGGPRTMKDRFLASFTPAVLGAGLGFAYARYSLDPEALKASNVPAMYASMGAVIGILVVRVASLFVMMFQDFFGKDDDSDT